MIVQALCQFTPDRLRPAFHLHTPRRPSLLLLDSFSPSHPVCLFRPTQCPLAGVAIPTTVTSRSFVCPHLDHVAREPSPGPLSPIQASQALRPFAPASRTFSRVSWSHKYRRNRSDTQATSSHALWPSARTNAISTSGHSRCMCPTQSATSSIHVRRHGPLKQTTEVFST